MRRAIPAQALGQRGPTLQFAEVQDCRGIAVDDVLPGTLGVAAVIQFGQRIAGRDRPVLGLPARRAPAGAAAAASRQRQNGRIS